MCGNQIGTSEEGRARLNGMCEVGCRREVVGQMKVERE